MKKGLMQHGHVVDFETNGHKGFEMAMVNEYDLVLLDLMLPGQNGFEILHNLRQFNNSVPVIVLSALNDTKNVIKALDEGAWDYLKKPFSFEELLARIRVIQRKLSSPFHTTTIKIGPMEINFAKREVIRAGQRLFLTNKQFALLELLWQNAEKVISKYTISEKVWEREFDTVSNIIEVTMYHLRKKIDPEGKLIKTIIGRGYMLTLKEYENT